MFINIYSGDRFVLFYEAQFGTNVKQFKSLVVFFFLLESVLKISVVRSYIMKLSLLEHFIKISKTISVDLARTLETSYPNDWLVI